MPILYHYNLVYPTTRRQEKQGNRENCFRKERHVVSLSPQPTRCVYPPLRGETARSAKRERANSRKNKPTFTHCLYPSVTASPCQLPQGGSYTPSGSLTLASSLKEGAITSTHHCETNAEIGTGIRTLAMMRRGTIPYYAVRGPSPRFAVRGFQFAVGGSRFPAHGPSPQFAVPSSRSQPAVRGFQLAVQLSSAAFYILRFT